jgi:hypothetical protein
VIHLTRNVCDSCAVWCQFDPSDWERTARENPTYASNEHESTHLPSEADCWRCLDAVREYAEEAARRQDDLPCGCDRCLAARAAQ